MKQTELQRRLVAAYQRGQAEMLEIAKTAIHEAVLAEREACAKVCDVLVSYSERQKDDPTIGKYVEGFGDGSISCAAAIRARSDK